MGKIARRFGVGETCIRDVLTGKRFADVLDIETGTEAAVSAAWVLLRSGTEQERM
jgi:DNA-binding FadR family transcriptional regulator